MSTREKFHSPFHVIEGFLSPAHCEQIVDALGIRVPSLNQAGFPLKHERFVGDVELGTIQAGLRQALPAIEARYNGLVKNAGTEPPLFQQYFEDPKHPCELHGCESAKFIRKKWVKHRDVDLVGFIWLKDFEHGVPLDPRYEVYGGKLEFPAYNFSLVPQRGTLVLFPAGPHFITAISPVMVGSLEVIKLALKLTDRQGGMYLHQPANFPGDYTVWFE